MSVKILLGRLFKLMFSLKVQETGWGRGSNAIVKAEDTKAQGD